MTNYHRGFSHCILSVALVFAACGLLVLCVVGLGGCAIPCELDGTEGLEREVAALREECAGMADEIEQLERTNEELERLNENLENMPTLPTPKVD